MSWTQLFWKVVLVLGVILVIDSVVGGAIIASLFGPKLFLIAGLPQALIGAVLVFFGWKYSK
jgi:hypothetical protein